MTTINPVILGERRPLSRSEAGDPAQNLALPQTFLTPSALLALDPRPRSLLLAWPRMTGWGLRGLAWPRMTEPKKDIKT